MPQLHPLERSDSLDWTLALQELHRLLDVMYTLRRQCPWDAEQTHMSLVTYLVEETCEVVEAIETGSDTDLIEELGDLLLQVLFHAEIASQEGRFDIADVARNIADKLISRHPYIYADSKLPEDLLTAWEQRKKSEKRRSSALDGIPARLSALTRAEKSFNRADKHGFNLSELGITATDVPSDQIGNEILKLVAAAQLAGVDAEQATRAALLDFEVQLRNNEKPAR